MKGQSALRIDHAKLLVDRERLYKRIDELLTHNTALLFENRELKRRVAGCSCEDGLVTVYDYGKGFVTRSREELQAEFEAGAYPTAS